MKRHRILDMTLAYDGHFSVELYRLEHTLFEGGWSPPIQRELIERGRVAAVLPYDPRTDQVLLIEQFRIGAVKDFDSPWMLEVVAGVIEGDETPEDLARREALEEAGCELHELMPITRFLVSPGCSSELCSLYCGRADLADAGGVHGLAEEGENILVHKMPAARAIELLHQGAIANAITTIALQWLETRRLSERAPFA